MPCYNEQMSTGDKRQMWADQLESKPIIICPFACDFHWSLSSVPYKQGAVAMYRLVQCTVASYGH